MGFSAKSKIAIGLTILFLISLACSSISDTFIPGMGSDEDGADEIQSQPKENPSDPFDEVNEDEKILDVVYRSVDALNAENPDAYLLTIHPQSKFQRKDYVDGLNEGFATFDAYQVISDVEIEYVLSGEAKVSFVMTVDFNSPDFLNTRITGVYILQLYEGNWLIYDDEILEVEPIP